jgi:hypothetical protein
MPKAPAEKKTAMVNPISAAGAGAIHDPGSELKGKSNIPEIKSDISASNIPQVGNRPDVSKFSGSYTKASDGEEYALAVVDDDPLGRTHKALNSMHYWEGTKAEFREQFDVKENDKRAPKEDDK